MIKYTSVLAITCGALSLSSTAVAIEEVIVTGYPQSTPSYNVPGFSSSGTGSYGSSFGFSGGYKDAAIAQAKQSCVNNFAAAQKQKCDKEKENIFEKSIQHCGSLGTNGTYAMAGGGLVAGGGAIAQQNGNYACRDQANLDYQYNTQACINCANKIKAEYCSKIY